ncbi:hypothetical protein MKW92_032095 [Papaver armeniacum]|nr:hypothetical protein MKW92_032095 [Papaver armeniacum]
MSYSAPPQPSFAQLQPRPPPPPPPPSQPQSLFPWSSGLSGCFDDCGNCCLTCWCPCITFGQISEILDRGSSACGFNGALHAIICILTCCTCIYSCLYRNRFRKTYNLEGSSCTDCLIHSFCEPCSLCQQYRELKNRGFDVSLGWHGNMERGRGDVALTPPPAAYDMER